MRVCDFANYQDAVDRTKARAERAGHTLYVKQYAGRIWADRSRPGALVSRATEVRSDGQTFDVHLEPSGFESRVATNQEDCMPTDTNTVDHPVHYNAHPAGIECIDVVEHLPFNIGNAVKYLWRCDHKGAPIEDLRKAAWYIDREIQRRLREAAAPPV